LFLENKKKFSAVRFTDCRGIKFDVGVSGFDENFGVQDFAGLMLSIGSQSFSILK
jgi:hypothetical protein